MSNTKNINSIVRAAEILKCLTTGDYQLSFIARKLGYSKTTVFRVIKTLENIGFAIQDPLTSYYHPGPLLGELTSSFEKTHRILSIVALKHMETLRDSTDESVTLQIPIGTQRTTIAVAQLVREYVFSYKPGNMAPISTGASGKILLSMYSDNDLNLLMESINLIPLTDKTVVNKTAFLKELNQIRSQGYVIESNEISIGTAGISVPVFNYSCPIALTIAGIGSRILKNSDKILQQLQTTSKIISIELSRL